jgi:hypothetical protein
VNEDQVYDAAEREMDLYRREIMRLTADGDALREQLADATARGDRLEGQLEDVRHGVTALAERLTASAAVTRPSAKSRAEDECAAMLRQLLEGE